MATIREPSAVIGWRACALLREAALSVIRDTYSRGELPDDEIVRAVHAIDTLADAWQAANGTTAVPFGAATVPETSTNDKDGAVWVTTQIAADLAGMTDRAIRKAISVERVLARRRGGRWEVSEQSARSLRAS